MSSDRYSRNTALFGVVGQNSIASTPVVIVGLGGLGSHIAVLLALLGVQRFLLVDHDWITESSMNRVVTAIDSDVAERTYKTAAAERAILAINPNATVVRIEARIEDPRVALGAWRGATVFGCIDSDPARIALLDKCSQRGLPLFDLATDTDTDDRTMRPTYGGRMVLNNGQGCVVCLGVLDQRGMAEERMSDQQKDEHRKMYGVDADGLEGTGPAVVSLNATVASLAVTEFMHFVTGIVEPERQLTYLGEARLIRKSKDAGVGGCYYCSLYNGKSGQTHRFAQDTGNPSEAAKSPNSIAADRE